MALLADIILRDTRANQPAAGTEGRLYYVTDENTLERDSGSVWEDVEGAGGGGSGTTVAFAAHKNGTNQTGVLTGTWTLLTWSTERFDTNSNFASDRFTPTVAAPYLLSAAARVDVTTTAFVVVAIWKNGAELARGSVSNTTSSDAQAPAVVVDQANGSTDYYEAYVYQASGSTQVVNGTAELTYFSGAKVG